MADFRKWILLLAVLALAGSAFAQPIQVQCVVQAANNLQVRGGGLTELTGDVTLACVNATTTDYTVTFISSFPGFVITNKLLDNNATGQGWKTASTLQRVDPGGNALATYQGYLQPLVPGGTTTAGAQTMNYPGVFLPQGTTFSLVIQNIRIATTPVANTAQAVPVVESLVTSPFVVNISNPTPTVATVFPPLTFQTTDCAGGPAPTMTFKQCISEPSGGANTLTFGVQFKEGIVSAFKQNSAEYYPAGATTNWRESDKQILTIGNHNIYAFYAAQSVADTATRLIVRWTQLPAGVTLKVTNINIGNSATTLETPLGACFVPHAGVSGGGGDPMDCSTVDGGATCSKRTPAATGAKLMTALSSGDTTYAVWQINREDPNQLEALTFGVQVNYSKDTVGLTAAGATPTTLGAFAPISTVAQATATDNVPRFLDLALSSNAPIVIAPCRTNLLFPYLTNVPESSYDSGVALVNTTTDPFGTRTQHGACTTYWYGNKDIAPQTTDDFGPGGVAKQDGRDVLIKKFSLSSPLPEFTESTAGFEGYMIARCNAQLMHGFAFVVSLTDGFGSEAYLALVIPDRGDTRVPDPFSTAGAGSGEQLVH